MPTLTSKATPASTRDASSGGAPAISLRANTLRLSENDGSSEREADRLAEDALREPRSSGRETLGPGAAVATHTAASDLFDSAGSALDPPLRREFETRFGHDFSNVRVHATPRAAESARELEAVAFTVGEQIGFARGAYSPRTTAGRQLLAHELAHTVQSQQGRYPDLIHRRRVPTAAQLSSAVPAAADTGGVMRARTGLARVLSRAWASLTTAQRTSLRTAAAGFGITFTNEANLLTALNAASRTQLTQFAAAIHTEDPTRDLGDPALIDIGARPATADAANITKVVGHADGLFAKIASGAHDASLAQVFGTANVATAKTKYAAARTSMNALHGSNGFVTDRSGYGAEVSLGGLSDSTQISVEPSVIDSPDDIESRLTLLHESMHAGNTDIHDFGYIDQPAFTALPAATKLVNAAHYEVVPRRIEGAANAFPGVTFTPAGTGATPALTPTEQAIREASEHYRSAWTAGLNLHALYVRLFRNPAEWTTLDLPGAFTGAQAGSRFSTTLPFWSKVQLLTIHTRLAHINPAGPAANQPVTTIDIALSEGFTRKLSQGMDLVPPTPIEATAFETSRATAAERTAAAASVNAERDLLIRLVRRAHLGSITGDENRDVRAIAQLTAADRGSDFSEYLRNRSLSAFP